MKAYTDVTEWLLAMRNFADANPDLFWLSTDPYPYVGCIACDPDDPDPSHVRTFTVTLGALRRVPEEFSAEFTALLRPLLKTPQMRAKLAQDLNDPGHPRTSALLDKASAPVG